MKKMNNKGFAISTMLYGLLILIVLIVAMILSIMAFNRKNSREFSEQVVYDLEKINCIAANTSQVGCYDKLIDAINNSSAGTTIKLLQNINENIVIDNQVKVEINLNGKTINGSIFNNNSNSNVTISNGSIVNGKIYNQGTMIINSNVKVTNTEKGIYAIENVNNLTIKGGTYTSTDTHVVYTHNIGIASDTLTITGGTYKLLASNEISTNATAIISDGSAHNTMNIENATIYTYGYGIVARGTFSDVIKMKSIRIARDSGTNSVPQTAIWNDNTNRYMTVAFSSVYGKMWGNIFRVSRTTTAGEYIVNSYNQVITSCPTWSDTNGQDDLTWLIAYGPSTDTWNTYYYCMFKKASFITQSGNYTTNFYNGSTMIGGIWYVVS